MKETRILMGMPVTVEIAKPAPSAKAVIVEKAKVVEKTVEA